MLMEEPMQVPSGDQRITPPSSRVRELGLVLPAPPTPLGAYVESSDAGNLLFLSGILPVVNGIVLVHGIWFDAFSWSKVISILQNVGHRVITVHLSASVMFTCCLTRHCSGGEYLRMRSYILSNAHTWFSG